MAAHKFPPVAQLKGNGRTTVSQTCSAGRSAEVLTINKPRVNKVNVKLMFATVWPLCLPGEGSRLTVNTQEA